MATNLSSPLADSPHQSAANREATLGSTSGQATRSLARAWLIVRHTTVRGRPRGVCVANKGCQARLLNPPPSAPRPTSGSNQHTP